jgi:hypothetical protein
MPPIRYTSAASYYREAPRKCLFEKKLMHCAGKIFPGVSKVNQFNRLNKNALWMAG